MGQFRRIQPKIDQRHIISLALSGSDQTRIRTRSQSRFERKIDAVVDQLMDSPEHQPSRLDRNATRIERGQPFRNFVRVDEFLTLQHFGQNGVRSSRFPRPVAPRYDVKVRHIL